MDGSYRPEKVLEFLGTPGKLLELEKLAKRPGIVIEFT